MQRPLRQQTLNFEGMAAGVEFAKPIHQELEDCVCKNTVQTTLQAAVDHCKKLFADDGWFKPGTASKASPLTQKDFQKKVQTQRENGTKDEDLEIGFGGSLAQIDLDYRVCDLEQLDLRRMKFLAEQIGTPNKLQRAIGAINVQGETAYSGSTRNSSPAKAYSINMKRLDFDAAVDMICLTVYWSRNSPEVLEALKMQLNNCVFNAQFLGISAVDLEVERFERYAKEDHQKNAMGRSAWYQAIDLLRLVRMVPAADRVGKTDKEVAAMQLAKKAILAKSWKPDTCDRCLPHPHRAETLF